MSKSIVASFALILIVLCTSPTFGENNIHYCDNLYDEYRQMRYWAAKGVRVYDYEYGSGDAEHLHLVHESYGADESSDGIDAIFGATNEEMIEHFDSEFEKSIRQNLPFYEVHKGRTGRFLDGMLEYGEKENFIEMFEAQEEARRVSLYGEHPGAINCVVQVERREFPVLYEATCNILVNKIIGNVGGLKARLLSYSSPEHVLGSVKKSLTTLLERLGRRLHFIWACH